MQYLRMLTNALIAGALVGAYVALLVLQLNPMVRLDSMDVARLMLTFHSVADWSMNLSMSRTPFTHNRAPSSLRT